MSECKFEIKKEIAVLSEPDEAVQKKLCIVSWNDKEPVFDLRAWSSKTNRPYKGITLTESEIKALFEAIKGLEVVKS